MTTNQMLEGCRKGDPEARRELYEWLAARMFGVVRRYVNDRATAEDLLHDGFVTLFTRIGDYRGEGSFEGWCRRIFVNTALGWLRKSTPMWSEDYSEVPASSRQVAADAVEKISAEELMKCIDQLPVGYRTILNLYAVEGYSHAEIAMKMGISENTSRSQYSRARAKLLEIVERDLEYEKGEI